MLKTPLSVSRALLATLSLAALMGTVGCAKPNANNTQPGDYKKAPPVPPRPTTP